MNEPAADTFGISQIGQIAVPVSDIERAIRFYRDTLGMRFLFQAPPGLGFFDLGGIRLMLDGPAKAQAGNSSVIYYKVSDLQSAFTTLSKRGVRFEAEPHLIARMPDHELWMAFFRDPDSNLLAMKNEVRHCQVIFQRVGMPPRHGTRKSTPTTEIRDEAQSK
jgi:methylmalonyl-CoA/ethylmalonyl-CoA epimerase